MSKLKFLLVAILAIPFMLSSCSSSDDDSNTNASSSLNGTVWVWNGSHGEANTLTFIGNKVHQVAVDQDGKIDIDEGTYTYSKPILTLTVKNVDAKATIGKNSEGKEILTLHDPSDSNIPDVIYVKQPLQE